MALNHYMEVWSGKVRRVAAGIWLSRVVSAGKSEDRVNGD